MMSAKKADAVVYDSIRFCVKRPGAGRRTGKSPITNRTTPGVRTQGVGGRLETADVHRGREAENGTAAACTGADDDLVVEDRQAEGHPLLTSRGGWEPPSRAAGN